MRSAALLVTLLAVAAPLAAQTAPARTPEQMRASLQAHQADFDYLLGDWEFTSVSKEYGPGHGRWSAVRFPSDGGAVILDEYRVTGDSGETYYVTRTMRAYNAALDRWELVSTDDLTGLQNVGTGQRAGAEMRIEQRFGTGGPYPSLWRIRYYNIQPDRFSWTGDRSTDEGRTWSTEHLRIEARRIGPRHPALALTH